MARRASRNKGRFGPGNGVSSSVTSAARPSGKREGGSRIGARYRHTTPEMAAPVIRALNTRLTLTIHAAAEAIIQRN